MKPKIIIFTFIFSATLFSGLCSNTIILKTDFQDTQPKFFQNADGSFGGLCFELMELIEKNSNFRFEYSSQFIPSKRIFLRLQEGTTDVHVGFAKTAEREKEIIFSEPLYQLKTILISSIKDEVFINEISDIKKLGDKGVVLSLYGVATSDFLRKTNGLIVDDGADTVEANIKKLLYGRGQFFAYHDLGIYYEINKPQYKGKFKVQPIILEKYQHYIVFSQKTPRSYISELANIVKKLKASGEWREITDKYFKY